MRAISIALVFASHAGFGRVVPGGLGVTIFFFLSGYLITTLLTREWERYDSVSLRAFYLRRLVRLGPPILLAVVVSYALLFAGLAEGGFHIPTLISQVLFFYNYYFTASPAHETVDGLGVVWSLAVEEHFYIIWPTMFILICRYRLRTRFVVGLVLIVLIWRGVRFFVLEAFPHEIHVHTDTRLDSLLYGCLLSLMQWRGQAQMLFKPNRVAMLVWVVAGLAALGFCLIYRNPDFRNVFRYSVQGLALMPLFYYAVTQSAFFLFRPLNWGWVRWIGIWSFSIYLIHFVIIKALAYNGFGQIGEPHMVITSLALSIAFAALSYALVEKPFHPLRRKLVGHPT